MVGVTRYVAEALASAVDVRATAVVGYDELLAMLWSWVTVDRFIATGVSMAVISALLLSWLVEVSFVVWFSGLLPPVGAATVVLVLLESAEVLL